ncbi:MAG: presqualene diphosphate synthase HpnD [Betaproteobacteria bacterium]|nr:presqualene diphosphate synthase HpnD [Betaproteobacteria bacterium]
MSPDEYCAQRAAASGSSFYQSFRFLEPGRRRAITALYAFCREVDDVVDECPDLELARAKLDWWRNELAAVYEGKPQHPVGQALVSAVEHFGLARELFEEIIDGMAMDLEATRYPDFKSLQLYCYRVAGVVGLLAAEIFGTTRRETRRYAHDLGIAFQLTNILRDVGEDARRGRVYLPQDELARHGVITADLLRGHETPQFLALMRAEISRARSYYTQALGELPTEDRRAQLPGLIMAAIYGTVLHEIERDGCHVLHHRIVLPGWRKFWIAGRTYLRERGAWGN